MGCVLNQIPQVLRVDADFDFRISLKPIKQSSEQNLLTISCGH